MTHARWTAAPLRVLNLVETEQEAWTEDRRRIVGANHALTGKRGPSDDWWIRHGSDSADLPDISMRGVRRMVRNIEQGVEEQLPFPTLASSAHFRALRVEVLGNLLRALRKKNDAELTTFTVINVSWRFTHAQLEETRALEIKAQFQSHLKQEGISTSPGFLVAFLHGEFEPSTGLYQLHYHGITTTEKAQLLTRLKGKFGYEKTATGARPIVRKPVRDRRKQVTYLLKSYWPERTVRLVDGKPKRDRKPRRIKEPLHTQVLLWLDRHRLIDLTIMNGCWSNRLGGPKAMKRLYLSVTRR